MTFVAPDGPLPAKTQNGMDKQLRGATRVFGATSNIISAGVLSPVGDPVGQVLDKGLKPVGTVVNGVTGPFTDSVGAVTKPALEKVGLSGGKQDTNDEKPGGDRIGGNPQTGKNPLGL